MGDCVRGVLPFFRTPVWESFASIVRWRAGRRPLVFFLSLSRLVFLRIGRQKPAAGAHANCTQVVGAGRFVLSAQPPTPTLSADWTLQTGGGSPPNGPEAVCRRPTARWLASNRIGGGAEDVHRNDWVGAAAALLPPTAPARPGRWPWSGSSPDRRRAAAAATVSGAGGVVSRAATGGGFRWLPSPRPWSSTAARRRPHLCVFKSPGVRA